MILNGFSFDKVTSMIPGVEGEAIVIHRKSSIQSVQLERCFDERASSMRTGSCNQTSTILVSLNNFANSQPSANHVSVK